MIAAMKHRQSGFTTMELLTTLVLAGLLMAMAVPSFNRMVANNRIIDQTNDLVGALNIGRSEAIRRNTVVTLCRTGTASSNVCTTGNANWENWILVTGAGTGAATETVVRRGTFGTYGNSQHVSSSLDNGRIAFSPDGLARTGGALVGGVVDMSNSGADTDSHAFTVCSTKVSTDNIRTLTLGSSSRVTTTRETGTCS